MKSGEPGSPRRRGPPRQAYQYVRPLAVTLAIPLMLILTMARAELLQLTVEVVLDRLSPTRNDNDPAVLGDLDPHVLHTRLTSGPDSLGDVGLSECGGRASHCDYREVCLCAGTSEPRNEISDELGGILRPISRGELLAHGVERLPDVSDLRKNDSVPV